MFWGGMLAFCIAVFQLRVLHSQHPANPHGRRHSVVSFARVNPQLTADMVREAVGHTSEAVERGYFAAGDAAKAKVMEVLVETVKPAVRDCKTGVA